MILFPFMLHSGSFEGFPPLWHSLPLPLVLLWAQGLLGGGDSLALVAVLEEVNATMEESLQSSQREAQGE